MKMKTEILYATALGSNGNLVHVNDAEKGKVYLCVCCRRELILRKSGKIGKGSKRPHFAHNELTPNCNPETVLHLSFKRMTVDLLNKYLSEKKEFLMNLNCSACSKHNEVNLLSKVSSIKEEYNLKVCQPDIALLDAEENVIAVIEIVVTHKPDDRVLQYYQENKIILIQVNLASDEDLLIVEKRIRTPDIFDFCITPKCSVQTKYSIIRQIEYYQNTCTKCSCQIIRFRIVINFVFGIQKSLNFTDDEINLVKSNFPNILVKIDQSTNEKYPVSDCINCKRRNVRRHFRL